MLSLIDMPYEKRKKFIHSITYNGRSKYYYNGQHMFKKINPSLVKSIEISSVGNPSIMDNFHQDSLIWNEHDVIARQEYCKKLKENYHLFMNKR